MTLHLFAPWWGPNGTKRELGFMIGVKDPRPACDHHYKPEWWHRNDEHGAVCGGCGTELSVKHNRAILPKRRTNWRYLKLFIAKTESDRTRHGIVMAEIETHLTDGKHGEYSTRSTKAFVRLKIGFGGRYT